MDKDPKGKNIDQTAKLAEVIAGKDVDTLKSMILDQMGIENQDQLIDRVLDILDAEEEEQPPETEAQRVQDNIEFFPQQETDQRAEEEPHAQSNKGDSSDLFEMLLGNKELLMSILSQKLMSATDNKDDPRVQLLYALKPFCNEERQNKIESAARLMGYTKLFSNFKGSKR